MVIVVINILCFVAFDILIYLTYKAYRTVIVESAELDDFSEEVVEWGNKRNKQLVRYRRLFEGVFSRIQECRFECNKIYDEVLDFEKKHWKVISTLEFNANLEKMKTLVESMFQDKEQNKIRSELIKKKLPKKPYFIDEEMREFTPDISSYRYYNNIKNDIIRKIIITLAIYVLGVLLIIGFHYIRFGKAFIIPLIITIIVCGVLSILTSEARKVFFVGFIINVVLLFVRAIMRGMLSNPESLKFIFKGWGIALLLIGLTVYIYMQDQITSIRKSMYHAQKALPDIHSSYEKFKEEKFQEEARIKTDECMVILDKVVDRIISISNELKHSLSDKQITDNYWTYRYIYTLLCASFANENSRYDSMEDELAHMINKNKIDCFNNVL